MCPLCPCVLCVPAQVTLSPELLQHTTGSAFQRSLPSTDVLPPLLLPKLILPTRGCEPGTVLQSFSSPSH